MNAAMPMNPMMSSMPMGMSPSMPMAMMMPMSCHMTCAMTDKGMVCTMMAGEGTSADAMKDMCMMLMSMMKNGTPCMMACAGQPMMSCCGMAMMPAMTCEMKGQSMVCTMMPNGAMSMDMLKMCCNTMTQMMSCGMPMTMMCGNMPVMVCMR